MTDPILDGALELSALGLRVIPLHGIRKSGACTCGKETCGRSCGKHPRFMGWQKSERADAEQIAAWWQKWPGSNVGVVTGGGLMVLDVDDHDGHNGSKSLAELEQIHGPLPPTRRAITGSGGFHYYYIVGVEVQNSAGKIADGLDIRGDGGQVVAPPSRHLSGVSYRWDPESPAYIAEAPAWLVEAAIKAGKGAAPPAEKPKAAGAARTGGNRPGAGRPPKDPIAWLDGWISDHLAGQLEGPQPYEDGRRWIFPVCPWNVDHKNRAAFLIQRGDGTIQAGCHHAGCNGQSWHTLRELLDPEKQRPKPAPKPKILPEPPDDDDWIPFPGDDAAPPEKAGKDGGGEPKSAAEKRKEHIDGTDLASARLFIKIHGKNIHWIHHWGQWFGWNDQIWESDEIGQVRQLAEDVVGELEDRAQEVAKELQLAQAANDNDQVEILKKVLYVAKEWRKRVANQAGFMAMMNMAKHQPGISLRTDDVDCDPMLLSVDNGTIDLSTGKLRQPVREDLITKHIPLIYRPDAPAPLWTEFIDTIMQGNQDLIHYLQRAVGYSLTGHTIEQVCFFCHGEGANGKGTMFETIMQMMGSYAKPIDSDILMASANERHPTDIANLMGARFVSTTETEEGRRIAEKKLKWITGSDTLSARFMRENNFYFKPTHKLWIAGNHKPIIRGTDFAIWRRINLIPFHHVFTNPDTTFPSLLIPELPGILAWAVRGCLEWQSLGLAPPAEVTEATAKYRRDMDVFSHFLEDRCVINRATRVVFAELYKSYREWSEECGEFALSSKAFAQRLDDRGINSETISGGKKCRIGIGLIDLKQSTDTAGWRNDRQESSYDPF